MLTRRSKETCHWESRIKSTQDRYQYQYQHLILESNSSLFYITHPFSEKLHNCAVEFLKRLEIFLSRKRF